MRHLAGKPHHVPLEAKRAEDDSRGLVHGFEHAALLDVQFEVGFRVQALERLVRVKHPIEFDAVLTKRIFQPDVFSVFELANLVNLEAASRRG